MERQIYRALIVDDERPTREATARAMSAQAFWCDTAADGYEALGKFRQSRHDLVVTDLRMPGMHGYALTLELLNDPQPPRIVVLTAMVEPSLVKELFSRGVEDVVNKPIDVRVFATKMASLFQREQWRKSLSSLHRTAHVCAGHALIAEIEHALDQRSSPAPAPLTRLFDSASDSAAEPPEAMIEYLERMFEDVDGEVERRQTERASLLATITAIPLSRTLEPCGEPFKAAARDASTGGISLLHTRATTAEFLALRWQSLASPGRHISLLMRVNRCQPKGPFYEVAGEFVPKN